MDTYSPNIDFTSTSISEIPVNEELALDALKKMNKEDDEKKSVPTGLLRPEKKIDESQMADFSTPIEELMPGPNQMIQNEIMGPPTMAAPSASRSNKKESASSSKNMFGLSDEQFQAAIAGVCAAVVFSKPVQSRLRTMVPKFLNDMGDVSLTGLVAIALIVAVLFYFA